MKPIKDEEDTTLDALHGAMTNLEYSCYKCLHLNKDEVSCKAFPEQIPDSIINGPRKHTKRMFNQDNDIFFERRE